VDGILRNAISVPLSAQKEVVSHIKILSGMDISEKRLPQDGHLTLRHADREFDLRVSSLPSVGGEKLVLRILDNSVHRWSLDAVVTSPQDNRAFRDLVTNPYGMILVTGPTGCGKTTTLYALLQVLNTVRTNIVTVEDPVEYRLPGTTQVQVNPDVDLTFLTALRSFLRQDPNIILVGEVRDLETAKMVSQAALTGHLVMSTLHTNSAIQAITRLVEIGVEPFLVASALAGVSAQRLVRRICPNCREEIPMPRSAIERYFGPLGDRTVNMWHGRGCDACHRTGYSGRLAIHEVFMLSEEIRRLIAEKATPPELQSLAEQYGYRPMVYDGIKKVLRGLTTLAEVERVTAIPEE